MGNLSHEREVMAVLEGRSAVVPANLDAGVRASWIRSVAEHGLEPDHFVEPDVLSQSELVERRAPVEEMSALASPEIDRLFQRLIDHAQVVMLTDAKGVVVHFRSGASVVDRCSNLRVLPGSIWTEERQGTTGVGLCVREQRPLSIVMGEHFATRLAALSCTVAPIFGAEGRLAGVLNVTAMQSTDHSMQAVVREMVASSARRIENLFFDRRHARTRVLRLSRHDDFCDGAAEARLALDDSGRIIDATPLAQRLLGPLDSAGDGLIGRKLGAVAAVGNVERLLHDLAPAIEGAQGRIHLRLNEPMRRAVGARARTAHALNAVPARTALSLDEIVGSDPAMLDRLRIAQRVHARALPLLLQGESGSGKTQLARALHDAGPHAAGSFVAINCAAIPQELIESELFGYRAGAFTGAAKQGSPGRLVLAHGGTLFLDEIGDMPLPLQGRLLQVLSEGEFVPVGGTEPVRVRFALISASLHDLQALVRDGRFREDLYFRLSGATLTLPALRQRTDRASLIERAFERAAIEAGQAPCSLAEAARRLLAAHRWPGNMRELEHVARFATAVSESSEIDLRALPATLRAAAESESRVPNPDQHCHDDPAALAAMLQRNGWNVSATAAHFGVSRATLHRRLHEFGLRRPAKSERDSSRVERAPSNLCDRAV